MRLAEFVIPAPLEVRLAGTLITLPGLAGVVFAFALLGSALAGSATTPGGNSVYGEAAYYLVLGGAVLACGLGLLCGQLWARSPAVVIALLLGGVAWYMIGPSSRPELGLPLMALAAGVLVLLFREPARAWALGLEAGESGGPTSGGR